MKQMLKNKKVFILLGVIIIAVSVYIFSNTQRDVNGGIDYHCSTSFRLQRNNPDFTARLSIFLQLQKNGSALFDITGKVDHLGKTYDVARTYHFSYERQGDLVYHLKQISTSPRSGENVDDNVMNSLFFSTTQKGGHYVRIAKLENSYVIENLYSPLFICIVN